MITFTVQNKFVKLLGLTGLCGLSSFSFAQTFNWSQAGPVYNAGRARNMVVDKADPNRNTLYSGSVASGVFKSTDAGTTWAAINSTTTVRNISYMAQHMDNAIYVATGEGFLRESQKAKAQAGSGFYKLNGNQLDQLANSAISGSVITRIVCHPTDANQIVIASERGILLSTDKGFNFIVLPNLPSGSLVSGQDVKFDSDGFLYCTVGSEVNNTIKTKVFRSKNNSSYTTGFDDITPVSNDIPNTTYGRIELAISPSDNNVIYASVANKAANPVGPTAYLKGLFVSYNKGNTWALIKQGSAQLDPMTNGETISSGDYAHTILVNPTNPHQLFIGGYSFYVFTRNGGTDAEPAGIWTRVGESDVPNFQYYLHENIHDIKIVLSGSATRFYFVTDAGIFRSTDLVGSNDINPPSFQPFYKGMVTGQFNSVSIESKPASPNSATASPGEAIMSNNGFIGGSVSNGFTYFSGSLDGQGFPQVSQEISYLPGEIYHAEYSKILPNAVFLSAGKDRDGGIYRSSDVRYTAPALLSVNNYTGASSAILPAPYDFLNNANSITGTTFKLWENYGQVAVSPDSLVFYNDSSWIETSIIGGVATLISQTTFTFAPGRPSKNALIDSIAIRTGTAINYFNGTKVNKAFVDTDKITVHIKLPNTYTVLPDTTTIPVIQTMMGPVSAAGVTLDPQSGLDFISVTFTSPPFAGKTSTSSPGAADPSVYYKVFASIFYRYNKDDTISMVDNSITTKPQTYEFILPNDLRWSTLDSKAPKPAPLPTNQPLKIAKRISARLALAYNGGGTGNATAIVVSKSPLNLNDALSFIRVSGNGVLTTDANGVAIDSSIQISASKSFKVKIIEWSKSGTELYFVTEENKLFRVSNLFNIMDYTPSSYFGKLSTDIFKYNYAVPANPLALTTLNPNSPYRTTLLGVFNTSVSSIAIAKGDTSMAITFNDSAGVKVMYSGGNIKRSNYTNINFTSRNGSGLPNVITYCSMMEKDDSKKVFLGTDNGIYYTSNITLASPTWSNIGNGQLPNVQVFDIEQQTLPRWQSYNSGQIYAATNGRGIWTNTNFFDPTVVSLVEQVKQKAEHDLKIYPNPTDGRVFVTFNSLNGESVALQLMDINGRLLRSEPLGRLYVGQTTYSFDTSELSAGMYIVNVTSDAGIRRVEKLIVTR